MRMQSFFSLVLHLSKIRPGAVCTWAGPTFTLWSPAADWVWLLLYEKGSDTSPISRLPMEKGERGTWKYHLAKNLHGVYYQYDLLMEQGHVLSADPYARACGINGEKGMVVDLKKTDPFGGRKTGRLPFLLKILFTSCTLKSFPGTRQEGSLKNTGESIKRLHVNTPR